MGRRLRREWSTVRKMVLIYCHGQHGTRGQELCGECGRLWDYVQKRLDRCPFGDDKPTCRNCAVHCYRPDMRRRIREVMRYAGPRMAWRHPVDAILHFWDGRRPTPALPRRSS